MADLRFISQHEVGEKVAEQIKEKLDNLPPGEEKDRAVKEAHKELENLQRVQGMAVPDGPPDGSDSEAAHPNQELPAPGNQHPNQGNLPPPQNPPQNNDVPHPQQP